jgi:hypothetical protein
MVTASGLELEVVTCKVVEAAAVVAAPFVPEGDNNNDM